MSSPEVIATIVEGTKQQIEKNLELWNSQPNHRSYFNLPLFGLIDEQLEQLTREGVPLDTRTSDQSIDPQLEQALLELGKHFGVGPLISLEGSIGGLCIQQSILKGQDGKPLLLEITADNIKIIDQALATANYRFDSKLLEPSES